MIIGHHGTGVGTQPLDTLLDNTVRLTHFLDPYQVAIVAITFGANRYIEVHAMIDFVGLFLTQIPFNT